MVAALVVADTGDRTPEGGLPAPLIAQPPGAGRREGWRSSAFGAAKIHAYKLQEEGLDTVEANAKLGYPTDLRDYGLGAQILFDLGVRQFRFLTNNPKKVVGLEGYGLEMIEQVPIRAEANPHNEKYLETKKTKLGHLL